MVMRKFQSAARGDTPSLSGLFRSHRVSAVVADKSPADKNAVCHGPGLASVDLAVSGVVLHGRNSTETAVSVSVSRRRR